MRQHIYIYDIDIQLVVYLLKTYVAIANSPSEYSSVCRYFKIGVENLQWLA